MITFTDRAIDLLARADTAARRFNPDARVRLSRDGDVVRFELTDEPGSDDQVVAHAKGFTVLVQAGLEGTVDVVEPHDRLVVHPPGDDGPVVAAEP